MRQPLETEATWRGLRGWSSGSVANAHDVRTLLTEIGDAADGQILMLSCKATAQFDHEDAPVAVIKMWTDVEGAPADPQGGICNLYFIDVSTGVVVGRGRDEKESKAWAMGRAEARASGYGI